MIRRFGLSVGCALFVALTVRAETTSDRHGDAEVKAVAPVQVQQSDGSAEAPAAEELDPLRGVRSTVSSRPSEGQQTGAIGTEEMVGPPAPILDSDSTRVSFQARVSNSSGEPLPGSSVDLTFNVYTSGGGLVEGPIDLTGVPMNSGLVNVQIPLSRSSFNGEGRELGVSVDGGPELAPRMPLTAVPYAYRVDRVASEELDDQIELGDADSAGRLGVWSASNDVETVELSGQGHSIRTYGDDGLEQIRLWGNSYGEIYLHDSSETNDLTAVLSATSDSGGELRLNDAEGGNSIFADGGDGTVNAEGRIRHLASIGGTEYASLGTNGSGGGVLRTNDENGDQTVILGSPNIGGGGFMNMHIAGSIWPGVQMFGGGAGTGGGGTINALEDNNQINVQLSAPDHRISTYGSDGEEQIRLWGPTWGEILLYDGSETNDRTVALTATSNSGGKLYLYDETGASSRAVLEAKEGTGGAQLLLRNTSGTTTVEMDADHAGAQDGIIILRNADGVETIRLDANTGGDGRVVTQELQITGGSDLSEQFDVKSDDSLRPEPGMLVSIDPNDPGRLVVSRKAYDRTVAGVISGAGGIETGMMMGQVGSVADGQVPVALTGRVYCLADASNGAIRPGDLLTTSDVAGHAMKVLDHDSAQGAIIGKAMSRLDDGKGLVLVLVSLQ
jgi:hypothetical protein